MFFVLQLARVLEDATDMEHAKVTTHAFVSARIGQEQLVTWPVCWWLLVVVVLLLSVVGGVVIDGCR